LTAPAICRLRQPDRFFRISRETESLPHLLSAHTQSFQVGQHCFDCSCNGKATSTRSIFRPSSLDRLIDRQRLSRFAAASMYLCSDSCRA
jgi:hypothetical protein